MIKQLAFVLIGTVVCAVSAQAQVATTPKECYRRCSTEVPASAARVERHERKMTELQQMRKAESDAEKIKKLDDELAIEIERHKEDHLKACRKICRFDGGN